MKGPTLHLHQQADPDSLRDTAVVKRLGALIAGINLDCECRARLDDALARFTELEQKRVLRRHLVRARQHRERIKAILDFLQEVDHLITTEPDRSVYTEMALLFEEVAAIAAEGASSMHRLAALREAGDQDGA